MGGNLPLEENEMDRVYDVKCKAFLKEMETGKFYSFNELYDLILKSSLHRPKLSDSQSNAVLDMAFVESVIQSQYATGQLRCGEKNGERYYSKV
jgi:hypothetical protein